MPHPHEPLSLQPLPHARSPLWLVVIPMQQGAAIVELPVGPKNELPFFGDAAKSFHQA